MIKKNEKRVSIHILTKDRTEYLATLLSSLRNQSFKDWDLILLDNNDWSVQNGKALVTMHPLIIALVEKIKFEGHGVKILVQSNLEATKDIGASRNICIQSDDNPYGCRIDDDSILDCATRIFLSRERVEKMAEKKAESKETSGEKLTEKQSAYLQKLGYDGDYNISKEEAKILISELLENQMLFSRALNTIFSSFVGFYGFSEKKRVFFRKRN